MSGKSWNVTTALRALKTGRNQIILFCCCSQETIVVDGLWRRLVRMLLDKLFLKKEIIIKYRTEPHFHHFRESFMRHLEHCNPEQLDDLPKVKRKKVSSAGKMKTKSK